MGGLGLEADARPSPAKMRVSEDPESLWSDSSDERIAGALPRTSSMQDVSRRVSAPVTRPARDRGLEAEVGKAEGQPPLRGQRPRSLRSLFGKLFASSSANPRPPPAPGRAPPAKDPDLTDDHSVPVMVFRKCQRELSNLGVVQDIKAHEGAIWAMKFSFLGRFLATGGQDAVVRVWGVLDRSEHVGSRDDPGRTHVPVLSEQPLRELQGHTADILDLSWSATNGESEFLLSSSMDRTVRLWHASSDVCLRVFEHGDFVTCVAFYPKDHRYFLAGTVDGGVHLWSVPECAVVDGTKVDDMVTSACFGASGDQAVVGSMRGQCRFYAVQARGEKGLGLELSTQVEVKNTSRGARARKITGLEVLPGESCVPRLLVSSNDSRVRLFEGYAQRAKFKGHRNLNSQIRASASPDGKYVLSGSDDGKVMLWRTASGRGSEDELGHARRDKQYAYESFQALDETALIAIFAPERCRHVVAALHRALASSTASTTPEMGHSPKDSAKGNVLRQSSGAPIPPKRTVVPRRDSSGTLSRCRTEDAAQPPLG